MIYVKDVNGNTVKSVLETKDCKLYAGVMEQRYVSLSWLDSDGTQLAAGSYIEYGGETFRLMEPYTPDYKDEATYKYTPKFYDKVAIWSKKPFFLVSDSGIETDWSLTAYPGQFMQQVVKALSKFTGETYTFSVDSAIAQSTMEYLSFQNVSIFDGLTKIADAWDTEWWVDGKVIHLSKCQYGTAVTLEVGVNVGTPSVTKNKEGYYTRFYAFGSTRNITQDYDDSGFTNGLVNKRLTLNATNYPGGYMDIRSNLKESEIFVKTLIFDDIYPSSTLTISDVRGELKDYTDTESGEKIEAGTAEDGTKLYKQYTEWYFKIDGFTLDASTYDKTDNPGGMLISGKTLSVSFESGQLNGRDFELSYNDTTKEYRILQIEENGITVPGSVSLIPADGDNIILYNIRMPDKYVSSAQSRLASALQSEMEKQSKDRDSYTVESYPVSFSESSLDMEVGRSVIFKNGSQTLSTRVLKVEKCLDYPIEQSITVGEEKISSSTAEIKEEVVNANQSIDTVKSLADLNKAITDGYGRVQQVIYQSLEKYNGLWILNKNGQPNDPTYWTVSTDYTVYTKGDVFANASMGDTAVPGEMFPVAADYTTTGLFRAKEGGGLVYEADGGWYVSGGGGSGGTSFTAGTALELTSEKVLNVKFGTTATTACAGNDARLTDKRANPNALTWSGYSSGTYDGSAAKSMTIPSNTNQLTNGAGFIYDANGNFTKLTGSGDNAKYLAGNGTFYSVGWTELIDIPSWITNWDTNRFQIHSNGGALFKSTGTIIVPTHSDSVSSAIGVEIYNNQVRGLNSKNSSTRYVGNLFFNYIDSSTYVKVDNAGNLTATGDIVANATGNASSGLPTADSSTYGLVKIDGSTIMKNSSGQIYCTVSGSGTGGSTVSYSATLTSGTKIGTLTINGTAYTLYAPAAASGTGGITSVTTSGSGNAVTSASVSGSTLTLTKGSTFLTGVTTSGSGNVVTGISASNGTLTVTKGTVSTGSGSWDTNRFNLNSNGATIFKSAGSTFMPTHSDSANYQTGVEIWNNQVRGVNNTYSSTRYVANLYLNYLDSSVQGVKVDNAGKITSYGTTTWSDMRLKERLSDITGILEKVEGLSVFRYRMKEWTDSPVFAGVSAQEVLLLFPEVIEEDEEGYYSLDYSKLATIVAVRGAQELYSLCKAQAAEIETLKERISGMEAKMEALMSAITGEKGGEE